MKSIKPTKNVRRTCMNNKGPARHETGAFLWAKTFQWTQIITNEQIFHENCRFFSATTTRFMVSEWAYQAKKVRVALAINARQSIHIVQHERSSTVESEYSEVNIIYSIMLWLFLFSVCRQCAENRKIRRCTKLSLRLWCKVVQTKNSRPNVEHKMKTKWNY